VRVLDYSDLHSLACFRCSKRECVVSVVNNGYERIVDPMLFSFLKDIKAKT